LKPAANTTLLRQPLSSTPLTVLHAYLGIKSLTATFIGIYSSV
jgi:hypothetical protein